MSLDIFEEMIKELSDDLIIHNFLYSYLNPLESSLLHLSENELNERINETRNMYDNVKNEVSNQSKLNNHNIDRRLLNLQSRWEEAQQRRTTGQNQEELRQGQIRIRQNQGCPIF